MSASTQRWVMETLRQWPAPWWGDDWHPTETAPLHVREGAPGKWRRSFAWLPVRLNVLQSQHEPLVWLRTVERRTFLCAPWFIDGNRTYEQFRAATSPSQQGEKP